MRALYATSASFRPFILNYLPTLLPCQFSSLSVTLPFLPHPLTTPPCSRLTAVRLGDLSTALVSRHIAMDATGANFLPFKWRGPPRHTKSNYGPHSALLAREAPFSQRRLATEKRESASGQVVGERGGGYTF